MLGLIYWIDRKVTCVIHRSWKWMLKTTRLPEWVLGAGFIFLAVILAATVQFNLIIPLSRSRDMSIARLLAGDVTAYFLCVIGVVAGTFIVAPIWCRFHQWIDEGSFSYSDMSSGLGYPAWSNLLVSVVCLCLMWKYHVSLHGTVLLGFSLSYLLFALREEPRRPKSKRRETSEALKRLLERCRAALRPLKLAVALVRVGS